MSDYEGFENLADEVEGLEGTLGGAQAMTAAFAAELGRVQAGLGQTTRDLGNFEAGLSRGLRRAFDGLLFDGMRLSDALGTVARAMADTAHAAAMKPVAAHLGGLLADGLGRAVAGPTALTQGSGGAGGRLGARAQGTGAVHVTMNITTPDMQGFQRSQGQIAAQLGRALNRGQRNR